MIPGWIDLQVNGFKGVDFSDPNLKLEDIIYVNIKLLDRGVIGYCPTIISSPLRVYERNLPLLALASKSTLGAQILGIHLEGPFISPQPDARGVHPESCVLSPSIDLFEQFRKWSNDNIAIVTLAPEREGAMKLIEYIIETTPALVSIGHHSAARETIKEAAEMGARAATHIGNGIPNLIHRFDNSIWPTLAEDRLTGLFITDGFHLPREMVKVCLQAKGVSRFVVTSDLVHLAGSDPGEYFFHGIPVVLERTGFLHRKDAQQLAGSTSDMMESMNFLASTGELSEKDMYKIGFENPLNLIRQRIDNVHRRQAPEIAYRNQRFRLRNEPAD